MIRFLISTGEVSGDLQGSYLVDALKKEAEKRSIDLEINALGGSRMEEAGATLIADTSKMGAIGLWEVIPFVIPTFQVQAKVDDFLNRFHVDVLILIDYMGPNIRLGNKLRQLKPNIPIVYYIAPQEWAWRLGDGGTTDLIGFSDKILAIFQAESDFYSDRGGNVKWVGHPMLDTLKKPPSRKEAINKLGLKDDQKVLLLFPASRFQEINFIMPTLLAAARKLQKKYPLLRVIVPSALDSFEEPLRIALQKADVIGDIIQAKYVDKLKPFLFAAADLALGKSGTINMELGLNNVPQIVGYKVSRITAFLARSVLRFKVDHISPVNLLLNERLVPELIQEEFNEDCLFDLAIPLLEDYEAKVKMLEGYKRLRNSLGAPGVTIRAANEIFELIDK